MAIAFSISVPNAINPTSTPQVAKFVDISKPVKSVKESQRIHISPF